MSIAAIPLAINEVEELSQLWQRESLLFRQSLVIDCTDTHGSEESNSFRLARFLYRVSTPVFVLARERFELPGIADVLLEVKPPSAAEQCAIWLSELPDDLPNRRQFAGELSRQFTMDEAELRLAIATANWADSPKDSTVFSRRLWKECRQQSQPKLGGLAQRIDVKADWDDLVVGDAQRRLLKQIDGHVRSRWRVYDDWGLAEKMNRGLGISVLFTGESGTGKTMAAEVLANSLNLDLYRVDLSSVVNKYVGETEKHLRQIFDAFESCGAILFFDECDALFGKRMEVKDSHDHYANNKVSYLLQRLESYRGLAILAARNGRVLDEHFLRRLKYIINFVRPTAAERELIWRRLLPPVGIDPPRGQVPVGRMDYKRLAQFQFTGGSIQNVVHNSASIGAGRTDCPSVTMREAIHAVRDEYVKLERPINEAEFQWTGLDNEEAAA